MINKNIIPLVDVAQRGLKERGYSLAPLMPTGNAESDKKISGRVAAFAGRQSEATEYTGKEVETIISIPNISYVVLDNRGDLAHVSLGYGAESYNELWSHLGYNLDSDLGGRFGPELEDGKHFYHECSATSSRHRGKGLTGVVQSLAEIEAYLAGYREMVSYADKDAVPVWERLGARRTGATKNMRWDDKDHELYEMRKPLDSNTIADAVERIAPERDADERARIVRYAESYLSSAAPAVRNHVLYVPHKTHR